MRREQDEWRSCEAIWEDEDARYLEMRTRLRTRVTNLPSTPAPAEPYTPEGRDAVLAPSLCDRPCVHPSSAGIVRWPRTRPLSAATSSSLCKVCSSEIAFKFNIASFGVSPRCRPRWPLGAGYIEPDPPYRSDRASDFEWLLVVCYQCYTLDPVWVRQASTSHALGTGDAQSFQR